MNAVLENAPERQPPTIPDHSLTRVIGRGSYGEVWEARNVMGSPRAVKIVRRQDFESARPFEREFEGIQRYEPISRSHGGLVQVLHVGKDDEEGSFYYVMELADNAEDGAAEYRPKTLRGELQSRTALSVPECIEVGIALASALDHLHRGGLVHRDVKPSNIIFIRGMAKLADVGLVAQLSDARSLVGTEGYLAPEGMGQPNSDVYSLGKVLYECVTGLDRNCFPDVPETWTSDAESQAAFEFMEVVLRAAEGDPARRYGGMDEILADLALLNAGKSLRRMRYLEARFKRTLQVLAFSALGIAVASGAWSYERHRRGQVERAESAATLAGQRTRQLLASSLVAEARAVRLSGQAGARELALVAVGKGLQAGASLLDLRTQAASALALTDVGPLNSDRALTTDDGLATWSPDGSRALVVDRTSGGARLIDRDSGKALRAFSTGANVDAIALSGGARWAATLQDGRTLNLWNTADGRNTWSLTVAAPCLPSFSADGSWLVAATGHSLVARACESGSVITLVTGVPVMRGVYLAPDGQWIAALPVPHTAESKRSDLGLRIYTGLPGRLPTPEEAERIHSREIPSDIRLKGVSISADSRYLAAAVSEDRLRVWEMPSLSQMAWLRGHQRSVRGTAFHPQDSGVLASTSWDGTTQIWDIPTRQQILIVPTGGENVLLAPDRGELLLNTWDLGTVRSAPLSPRRALRVLMLPAVTPLGLFGDIRFSPDSTVVAAAGDAGVIAWDISSGTAHVIQSPTGADRWRSVVFGPDGGTCWFSGKEGLFRRSVSRDRDGRLVFGESEQRMEGYASFLQWTGPTLAVSGRLSPAGRPGVGLLTPDGTCSVLVPSRSPDRLAVSPNGRWLATTRYPDGGGTLWDLHEKPPRAMEVSTSQRAEFGFTSDSRVLITGTDREISFTRLEPFQTEAAPSLPRHNCEFVPAHSASSAAAGLTAVATGPTEITLCDTATLAPIVRLDSPLTPFDCSIAFSPDGKKLALAGGVSRVVIWDVEWIREELSRMGLGW